MQLSHIERVMLANQYKILSLLDPDQAEWYEEVREALEQGFESHYMEALHQTASSEVFGQDKSSLANDAMSLYHALQVSYDRLEDSEKADIHEAHLDFIGFDGNDEGEFCAYARFRVEREGGFGHLRFAGARDGEHEGPYTHERYNSHSPMTDAYRKQIERWKQNQDHHNLSAQEIKAILETY